MILIVLENLHDSQLVSQSVYAYTVREDRGWGGRGVDGGLWVPDSQSGYAYSQRGHGVG